MSHQTQLLLNANKESQVPYLQDEVDALCILIERCLELGKREYFSLEALCEELFGDDVSNSQTITLSSVHKSKGLEFPKVYLLGRSDYMPFFKAEAEWELEQERNLIYVAVTRAMRELVEVSGVSSALDKGLHRAMPQQAKPAQFCINHPSVPSRTELDGDLLCQACADAWVRAEGQAQADQLGPEDIF